VLDAMEDPRGPRGKKGPPRVEVIHFPKRKRRRGSSSDDLGSDDGRTRTVPEFTLPSDEPTQPGLETERSRRGGTKRVVVGGGTPWKGSKSKKGGGRNRSITPGEVEAAIAPESPRGKVRELVSAAQIVSRPRGMSAWQVAEMSLFGHHLFEAGRLEEARVVFEGLVSFGVEDAFPYTMLGTIYLALEHSDRALALFEAALEIDPADMAARVYRGEIRLDRGKLKPAMDDLNLAVAQGAADDPFVDRARRLLRIAQAKLRKGRR
jgi:hypothetical protein